MFVVLMINQMHCFDFITKARKVFKVSKEKDKALELPYYDLLEALTLLKESQVQIVEPATAIINDAAESKRPDEQDYLAAFSAVVSICQDNIKLLSYAHRRRDFEHIQYPMYDHETANHTNTGAKEINQKLAQETSSRINSSYTALTSLFEQQNFKDVAEKGIKHIENALHLQHQAYHIFLNSFIDSPVTEYNKFKRYFEQTRKYYFKLIESKNKVIILDQDKHAETEEFFKLIDHFIDQRTSKKLRA